MIFTLIPHEHVLNVWPDVAHMFERATQTTHGRFDKLNVLDELLDNHISLWVIYEEDQPVASLTTRVIPYKAYKSLSIDWLGGNKMSQWLDQVMDTLKNYAKDQGCSRLEGRGRSGWTRALKKYGWKPDYVAIELELDDE